MPIYILHVPYSAYLRAFVPLSGFEGNWHFARYIQGGGSLTARSTIMMVAVVYRLDWVAVSREAVAKASEKAAGTAEERPLAKRGGGDDEE